MEILMAFEQPKTSPANEKTRKHENVENISFSNGKVNALRHPCPFGADRCVHSEKTNELRKSIRKTKTFR
jgi:hypothetical protein